MSEDKKEVSPPVEKFKAGQCEVALWEQEGKNGKFLTASNHRSYLKTDDKGKPLDASESNNWAKTNSLRINDIPSMILCLQKAYEYAKMVKKKEAKAE